MSWTKLGSGHRHTRVRGVSIRVTAKGHVTPQLIVRIGRSLAQTAGFPASTFGKFAEGSVGSQLTLVIVTRVFGRPTTLGWESSARMTPLTELYAFGSQKFGRRAWAAANGTNHRRDKRHGKFRGRDWPRYTPF
jgi:hypothetical protein